MQQADAALGELHVAVPICNLTWSPSCRLSCRKTRKGARPSVRAPACVHVALYTREILRDEGRESRSERMGTHLECVLRVSPRVSMVPWG